MPKDLVFFCRKIDKYLFDSQLVNCHGRHRHKTYVLRLQQWIRNCWHYPIEMRNQIIRVFEMILIGHDRYKKCFSTIAILS